MQRKFLEDLGLEKEAIDKIMAENGNDIEAEKKKIGAVEDERDDYKQKFETADQSLTELKKKDIDGIEKELTEYKEKYEKLEKSISERDYESAIESYLSGYHFTSDLAKKAVLAEMKSKELKLEDGKLLGADDYMKSVMEANPGAFEPEKDPNAKPVPKIVSETNPGDGGQPMSYTREALEKMTPEEINTHWDDIQKSLKNIE